MVDAQQAEYEEETKVEASQAYNILAELEQEGLITHEKAELYKKKFYTLHDACIKEMQNERKLSEKVSQYKKVSPLQRPRSPFTRHRLYRMRRSASKRLSNKRQITSTSSALWRRSSNR